MFSPVVVVVVGLARILAGGRSAAPQPPKVCYVTERSIAEKKKKEKKKNKNKKNNPQKHSLTKWKSIFAQRTPQKRQSPAL